MAFNFSPKIVTDGLVLCLDAANSKSIVSGSTTWNDLSRVGNNGTLISGATFNSGNGGNIVFDGVNDYVQGASLTNLTFGLSNFTINHWFYINAFSGKAITPIIMDFRTTFLVEKGWADNIINNKYGIWYGNMQKYTSIGNIFSGTWYNIAFTRNGSTNSIYINGVLDGSYTESFNFTEGGYLIGRNINTPSTTSYLNGKVANVLVYRKALSSQEVLQNYNTLKTRFGL